MLKMESILVHVSLLLKLSHPRFSRFDELFLLIKGYQSPSNLIASVELISLQLTEFCQVAFPACYKALFAISFSLRNGRLLQKD